MSAFSLLFLTAVVVSLGLQLWLASRHIRHVAAHRASLPLAFAQKISLAAHQKAADYTVARSRFERLEIVIDSLILLTLTLGGGVAWLNAAWAKLGLSPLSHGIALLVSVLLISSFITLPLRAWRVFVIEERFGFNRITPKLFVLDLLKGAVVGALIGIPLLGIILWLMDNAGQYWWLAAWLTWTAFQLFLLAVYPTWIAPIFNKFSPLDDAALKGRITQLLSRCGFRSEGVFVMDGSKRSAHGNAYFTGFGAAKRIVFFDTLLSRLSPVQIEAVLAHELGHFKHKHVLKRMIGMFALSLGFLALLGYLAQQPWFYAGLGVPLDLSNPANAKHGIALLLFFLVLPPFTFLFGPISSYYSRQHEFEADAYAAQQVSAQDLIQALVKLYEDNASTLTPDPLHSAFYDSHPPAALRIKALAALA